MQRRHFLTGLGGAALVSVLPGCANQDNPSAATETPMPTAGASFPATVKHRYGSTTVASAPQRVITLGQTDHDAAIALGVVPIAVSGFLGSTYSPFRPWNSAGLSTKPPVLNMQEIEFEKVAALGPDLILAVMSGVTKEDYAKLSAIAPTVAQPVGYEDWAVPFQPHTELIGTALGQPDQAKQLVVALQDAFAGVRKKNPVLVGLHAVCAEMWDADFTVLGTGAPRTSFLTDIGMTISDSLARIAGKGYNAPLSAEKVDLLDDVDVVIWTTDRAQNTALLQHKLVRTLRTTKEGRYVLAPNGGDDNLLYSMDWGSILSNRWAIENAVPRILRAVDGDPATDPNAGA
jgi:iron complex transport system substrate-binding protein